MNFQEILKKLLNEKKLRQADLCRMTGIQTSLMSDYINGKKSPTIGNAILIADALNVSLDTLVGKDTFTPKQPQTEAFQELCRAVENLSENEQRFLLDTIHALKKHLSI